MRFEFEELDGDEGSAITERGTAPELSNRRGRSAHVRKRARRNRSNDVAKRGMHQRRNKRSSW
jgi:hypothetical protein